MGMENPKETPKPGPEPERLKIEGDWEDAVSKALSKPRPDEGWPDPDGLSDAELNVIAEMAENNGCTILGDNKDKKSLESKGLIQLRPKGGWEFTDRGRVMADEYLARGKAKTLKKRTAEDGDE